MSPYSKKTLLLKAIKLFFVKEKAIKIQVCQWLINFILRKCFSTLRRTTFSIPNTVLFQNSGYQTAKN